MARIVALTGTPGTGKTAVSEVLRGRGFDVVDLNALARERGTLSVHDETRDTWEVDLAALGNALGERAARAGADAIISEGHLAHLLPCEGIVVLRCEPCALRERLRQRDYPERKVEENVWAEALSVISVESREMGVPVSDVDTTCLTAEQAAGEVMTAMSGEGTGAIEWTGWVLENA